jgi:hypothetical protein
MEDLGVDGRIKDKMHLQEIGGRRELIDLAKERDR